ncbi:MAG: aminotransferase class I/II-fold pyridoxal phosphate-dependent enzyme, partial [Candidatus Dormibacteraeota bacterium]|nr:aminotransferase class I/II-fold pyridoxal phosphate-dependent enzyme [Candidatus Dormibacteraeota bacterium]
MSPPSAVVDLRSDTFTKPDAEMRRVMAAAEVGDDVWGEDPTVRRLEEEMAALLRKQVAVFVPSGTMGNLSALAAHTRPGDEVIVDRESHVVLNEAAGAGAVAGVMLQSIDAAAGAPTADQVRAAVREPTIHHPVSRLLWLENTHGGRSAMAIGKESMDAAATTAHAAGLRVHCDGARLFNAAVALGTDAAGLVEHCDTVSTCLSKGLGAPVGSVVSGGTETIAVVRLWRKRLGGGMRQSGILAAAGLHALHHNVERLAEDHANAALLAAELRDTPGVSVVEVPVPTNMVMFDTAGPAAEVTVAAAAEGVLIAPLTEFRVRCVTHRDLSRDDVRRAAR